MRFGFFNAGSRCAGGPLVYQAAIESEKKVAFDMRLLVGTLTLVLALPFGAAAQVAKPESVGFSTQRLERLHSILQQQVDIGQVAGIVTLAARHGKIFDLKTYGKKELASGAAMTEDSIFRIYSMTKPITGVAMMLLYEEGKWSPADPLSKHIPEFAKLKVFKGVDADGKMMVEAPLHAPTVGELMSHTAGFTYGIFGQAPVDKMYTEKGVMRSASLEQMIDKLADTPLLYQPGTRWVYSVSVDIQGYLVQKLSGKTLPEFMQERIFKPLGMKDTGFSVPAEKWARVASVYGFDDNGKLEPSKGLRGDYTKIPGMPSGGGGLVSTARDYYRFAQMLANGGELEGTRLLAPLTVKLMSSNHLGPELMTGEFSIGLQRMRPGFGFGYDVAVFTDPALAGTTIGKGSYLWDGAAGTWFWIDPENDIVFVGMIQRQGNASSSNLQQLTRAGLYQALVKP